MATRQLVNYVHVPATDTRYEIYKNGDNSYYVFTPEMATSYPKDSLQEAIEEAKWLYSLQTGLDTPVVTVLCACCGTLPTALESGTALVAGRLILKMRSRSNNPLTLYRGLPGQSFLAGQFERRCINGKSGSES